MPYYSNAIPSNAEIRKYTLKNSAGHVFKFVNSDINQDECTYKTDTEDYKGIHLIFDFYDIRKMMRGEKIKTSFWILGGFSEYWMEFKQQ